MSEQTANLCTTDACESLRARLAKYEDSDGRPVGQRANNAVITGMADALRHVIKELDAEACEDIDYAQVSGALGAYELFGRNEDDGQTYMGEPLINSDVLVERGAMQRLFKACGCSGAVDNTQIVNLAANKLEAITASAGGVDERAAFEVEIPSIAATFDGLYLTPVMPLKAGDHLMTVAQHRRILAEATHPADQVAEGVVVPRELLQDLRDLAFDQVEHHRAAMGAYKQTRQSAMDSVLAQADALLAKP